MKKEHAIVFAVVAVLVGIWVYKRYQTQNSPAV